MTRRPRWVPHPHRRSRRQRFTLCDAEESNARWPDTFWIPSLIERLEIRVGRSVKLGFDDSEEGRECMWVKVTERIDTGYIGTLCNLPLWTNLEPGDAVAFEPRHVMSLD